MQAYSAVLGLAALLVLVRLWGEVYFSITPLFGLILVLLAELVPYRLVRRGDIYYASFAADLAGFMMSGLWVAAANAFLGRFLGCLIAEGSSVYWPWRRALIRAAEGVVSLAVGAAAFSALQYLIQTASRYAPGFLVSIPLDWLPYAGMAWLTGLCAIALPALGESLRYRVEFAPSFNRNLRGGMVNATISGVFGWILGSFFTRYPVTLTGLALAIAFAGLVVYATRLYAGINELHWSTIRALISAVECRDIHHAGHAERVARYCVAVARKLYLPEWRVTGLYFSTLLHEVGMVGVDEDKFIATARPDANVQGKLDAVLTAGAGILERLDFSPGSALAVKYSRTWFNGYQSPDRTRGRDLPVEARILAACNAYDSMTSSRPYREAYTVTEALQCLHHGRYTRFDPEIVDIVEEVVKEEENWGTRVFCRCYNLDSVGQAPGW